jgi:hypothetical protein
MRGALLCLVALAAACDSRAKASDPAVTLDRMSKEFETCSATAACADKLRCFDHMCRRTARSPVGDYFAALGLQLKKSGDIEGSIDAYNRALGHYDSEKIALPPDIDCAYGAALAAGKAKKEHAELGARVLHRCMLAVPVGSRLREQALADLATLSDAGLDPLALGKSSLADVYLTRAPETPSTDKLVVSVTANPPVSGKTYHLIPDKLADPEMKTALVACWDAYNAATHKDALSVSLGMKSAYVPSEYEDESGTFSTKIDPPVTMPAGPDASAEACVRAAVEPAIKGLALRDSFATKLTISVK